MPGNEYYKDTALLQAEMIVAWKQKRGIYNFQTLPGKAVIALTHQAFSAQLRLFSRNIKGINGKITAEGDYLYCSGFGSGAPALITLMEELRALGVTAFTFIGLCAALYASIEPGTAFQVQKAWSASGITASYVPDTMIAPYDPAFVQEPGNTLQLKEAICCSTDSPFRETASFLEEARAQGCTLIEMECAAAYAFSRFYKMKVACFLVAADRITETWIPPSDMPRLLSVQQQLVDHIVKQRS
jgi:uridine phosphorylase